MAVKLWKNLFQTQLSQNYRLETIVYEIRNRATRSERAVYHKSEIAPDAKDALRFRGAIGGFPGKPPSDGGRFATGHV